MSYRTQLDIPKISAVSGLTGPVDILTSTWPFGFKNVPLLSVIIRQYANIVAILQRLAYCIVDSVKEKIRYCQRQQQWANQARFQRYIFGDRFPQIEMASARGGRREAPSLRCRVGLLRVSPLQPTRGSGERRVLPVGSGADPQPGKAFWSIVRSHNAPFCTYMPTLWVHQTVFHVTFGGQAEVWGQLPPIQT